MEDIKDRILKAIRIYGEVQIVGGRAYVGGEQIPQTILGILEKDGKIYRDFNVWKLK